ncbi:MAG: serine/threonine-protein kinase [Acidobacteria bacterium]|nr:serine/threonine-protein kinase [Acidobacteriota bacterium]
MALASGTRLGSYEIVAPLGAGGMGEVYRALDVRLKREVAVKIIPVSEVDEAGRLARFEQEARAAAVLNHPNVMAVYDVGTYEGRPYVVSELLEGETLRGRMAGQPIPPRKAVAYALHVARGLAAAHDRGIVHRDLKPENVFITRDGSAKILDFGLVKLTQPAEGVEAANGLSTLTLNTQPGVVVGTVGYMSPEQVRSLPVDHRSDIFSFGVILYEMLWGERAFRRDSSVETLNAILHDTPSGLLGADSKVSPGLEHIVGRCLEKEPDARFQSTRDLVFSLEEMSEHSGSGRTNVLPPPAPSRRRLWAALGLAALVAALCVGGFALGRLTARHSPPEYRQLTFRRGLVDDARFSPDGQMVYYSAAWDGRPSQLYFTRPGSPESSPVSLPESARLLSVSSTGQLAVLLAHGGTYSGMLAQMPLTGGTPRELYDNVQWADWSPDGTQLAAVRGLERKTRLEYPLRNVLFETAGSVICPRVSPRGDAVAFIHQPLYGDNGGAVMIVDRAGQVRNLSQSWPDVIGLAWSPRGDEVWFTASERGANRAIYAADMSGRVRLVERLPSRLTLTDIAPDGRVLFTRTGYECGMMCRAPGSAEERNLYWLDGSIATDLSDDGKTLLFVEAREGASKDYAAYLRGTDGAPAVLLGEGFATDLSPDGKWVLAIPAAPVGVPAQIDLLPTGVGERRRLTNDSINHLHDFESYVNLIGARWFPDGRRILFTGEEQGHGPRCYVQSLDGGPARAITPDGVYCVLLSPDGKFAVGVGLDQKGQLYPVDGGPPAAVTGLEPGDVPTQWGVDGNSLYVQRSVGGVNRVYKLDTATGRKVLWREFAPADATGMIYFNPPFVTPDGRSYAYSYARGQNDLYLVAGLE